MLDLSGYYAPTFKHQGTAAGRLTKWEQQLQGKRTERILRPLDVWASDYDLRNLAAYRAEHCSDWAAAFTPGVFWDAINEKLESLEARPMRLQRDKPIREQIQAAIKRLSCNLYWRRQLRRAQVRKREAQEQAAGHIWARGMPYVHDTTLARHIERQAANRAMMEATEIENQDGEILKLWDAAQASTANKSIRRGELMTRIRGCEEWANARGMVGMFTTNTLPSRFHATLFSGGSNYKFTGDLGQGAGEVGPMRPNDPSAGQAWLSATWAKVRAKLQRKNLGVFGFRVAEPHHDGCPHWHMLLWAKNTWELQHIAAIMRAYWLQEAGDEPGAQEHRFKADLIDPAKGGAVAYVSKYIAKNIDDAGSVGEAGHLDYQGQQKQLIEGGKAQRVTAWASAHNIRQFQPIGQPPVTVWRELRRVDGTMAAAGSKRIQRAWAAVHKGEAHRADWCGYMVEQGGAMVGRAYQLRLVFDEETREGRYGPSNVKLPKGVWDVNQPGEECTSKRKTWKPKGTWSPAEIHLKRAGLMGAMCGADFNEFTPKRSHTPEQQQRAKAAHEAEFGIWNLAFGSTWTRFNNCTQSPREKRAATRNTYQFLIHRESKPAPLRH